MLGIYQSMCRNALTMSRLFGRRLVSFFSKNYFARLDVCENLVAYHLHAKISSTALRFPNAIWPVGLMVFV